MKNVLVIILAFYSAHGYGQNILTPKGFEILAEKVGDLNKDGIDEKVIVYNTTDTTEDGIVRELQIFRLISGEWKLWKKSRNAIKKSQEGGMMGDPFAGIDIVKGLLVIDFNGGSSWKWNYTDKYRFQHDEFELIGYKGIYGKLCEYWEEVDFNIVTGKIIYNKEYEDCEKDQQIYKRENETFFRKGISININNRNLKEYKITSPKYKHEHYL
jgi:hypothetical protein